MSNKWKALLIISLVFNIAVAGALVYGRFLYPRYAGRDQFPGVEAPPRMQGMHLGRRMGLTREKMIMMGTIFDELHRESAALRDSLRTARGELFDLLHREHPDETAVMEKIDEISVLQGGVEKALVRRLLRVHEILGPEEREELFDVLRRRMHSGFPRRMGRQRGGPGHSGGMR
jgi:Spy/CpxP family protein refolding chaperone